MSLEQSGEAQGTPRRMTLHTVHLQEGARMSQFVGWDMPIQYGAGIREEHLSVRSTGGVFVVSHMGEINVRGKDSLAYLQQLLPTWPIICQIIP